MVGFHHATPVSREFIDTQNPLKYLGKLTGSIDDLSHFCLFLAESAAPSSVIYVVNGDALIEVQLPDVVLLSSFPFIPALL